MRKLILALIVLLAGCPAAHAKETKRAKEPTHKRVPEFYSAPMGGGHGIQALGEMMRGSEITPLETIPDFGANPTIFSAANGAWSAAGTWSPARVPVAGDVVAITHSVTYDAQSSARLKTVQVRAGGKLAFKVDATTLLTVQNFMVLEGGSLEIGTETYPIQPNVTATVVYADLPLDANFDPGQYGNGLIALGKVRIHGAPRTSFVRLTAEPQAGQTSLALEAAPTGWRQGDKLYLPDSRSLAWNERDASFVAKWEYPLVSTVSGTTVGLSGALANTHPGSHIFAGDVPDYLPHIANLTRNIIFKSENPNGTRGHTFFNARADVDVRYAQFLYMGRTKNAPSDATNVIGRYAAHFHHYTGPTSPQPNGRQFTFIGNSLVNDTAGTPFRWPLVVHASHYGLIQDNVVNGGAGAGIVTEDGSETGNIFSHNFVSRTTGTGNRVDTDGAAGSAYWFRGPNNIVIDNVATNHRGGTYTWGFDVMCYFLGTKTIPAAQGQDPSVVVDMNAMPLPKWERNEAYGASDNGMTIWWVGAYFNDPRPNVGESIIKDQVGWNLNRYFYFGYETSHLTIDHMVARGNYVSDTIGMQDGGDYFTHLHLVKNVDIRGVLTGYEAPVNVRAGDTMVMRDSFFDNLTNIAFTTLRTSGSNGSGIQARRMELRNVKFGTKTPHFSWSANPPRDIVMGYFDPNSSAIKNWIQTDQLFVYDHNGVAGDNFQTFYTEQAPSFVLPATGAGQPGNIGCPTAGLTNDQCLAQQQKAMGGAVAPCATTRSPRIKGFVCATGPPVPIPTNTPAPALTSTPTRTPVAPTPTALVPTATAVPPISTPTRTPPPSATSTPVPAAQCFIFPQSAATPVPCP